MSNDFDMFGDEPAPKAATPKPQEKQQEVKPAPLPKQPDEIDLANVAPEKRERLLSQAKLLGWKVKNEHLVEESKAITGPKEAMLLEFPENPPSEAQGMTPLFRMTRQRDLDILFCGLGIGPIFQDKVELAIKNKFLDSSAPERIVGEHFVVFVYLAIALPFGEDDKMHTGWALTFFCPKEFERIMPKALRVHLGIDIWYEQHESRFDVVYYKVAKVANDEEKEKAIVDAKRTAALAWALVTHGAPKPEIPKQTIDRWVAEYYEKHPDEKPVAVLAEEKKANPPAATPTQSEAAKPPAKVEVPASPKPGEIIYAPEPAEDDPVGSTHPAAIAAYEREKSAAKAIAPAPKKTSMF